MRFKAEGTNLEIELTYESDILITSFFEKDELLSVLKTRGQESTQMIAVLKREAK